MICVCCVMIKEKSIESLQLESQRWAFFNGILWTGGGISTMSVML